MVKNIILSQQVEPSEISLESTSMIIYCDQTLESNGIHFDITVDYFTLSIKNEYCNNGYPRFLSNI